MNSAELLLNDLCHSIMTVPPKMSVSQWARENFRLSTGAEKGRFVPKSFQVEVLDAIGDARVREITIMAATQLLKTVSILVGIAYIIAMDPDPIMVVMPRDGDVDRFSKFRLAPMLRDIPALVGKVSDSRSRDSLSTINVKDFQSGPMVLTAAGSPGNLASVACRFLLCDEIDKFDASSGNEGDPISLAYKRQATFRHRAKTILTCSPTIKGRSRIEIAYEDSDQRQFWCPCAHCGVEQVLKWGSPESSGGVKWDNSLPAHERAASAYYECEHCSGRWNDLQRMRSVDRGRWIARKPFMGKAGFHISEIYSSYKALSDLVSDFLFKKSNPLLLRTFVNTSLGEVYSDPTEAKADASELAARAESYGPELPREIGLLTAGADVQANRIEAELVGWGVGEESWSVEHRVFLGDTSRLVSSDPLKPTPWEQLDGWLNGEWLSECDMPLRISAMCVDAGYQTAEVAKWCGNRFTRRVWATIGRAGSRPVWPKKPGRTKSNRQPVFVLGVDAAKESVYSRLSLAEPGPGYLHFPKSHAFNYFEQLTSEVRVPDYTHPIAAFKWQKKNAGIRNEVLDCRTNAYGAMCGLLASGVRLDREVAALNRMADAQVVRNEVLQLGNPEAQRPADPQRPVVPQQTFIRQRPRMQVRLGGFAS